MQKLTTNIKIFVLSYIIVTIPFLEFLNSNINNIDRYIFNYLVSIYILVFVSISLINYIFLKFSNSKSQIYIISLSFFFWLLFRFKSIKDFLGGSSFKLSAELSLIILLFIFIFFIIIILNEKIYRKFYKFLFLFFIFQNIIILVFISLSYFKYVDRKEFRDNNYQEYVNHINKEREYFSEDEIISIKKKLNKNIYLFIFDGMTSLEMYKRWNAKKNIDIKAIKKRFLDKNYVYIDNSLVNYGFTNTSFGSMLQMQHLFTDGITKYDKIYKEQLFPQNISNLNFKKNKHPNLVYNLYKLDYKFIWLGSMVGCNIYNPQICINFTQKDKIKGLIINWNIMDIFLENTPLIQIYNVISDYLLKKNTLDFSSKNNERFDFTDEFLKNSHLSKNTSPKQNYFYLIHNLFPKSQYVFDSNCNKSKKKAIGFNDYINNYDCTLKTIDKLIIFLEKKDPDAVVIFQSDHGIDFNEKNNNLEAETIKSKIFNLIKVPKSCKNALNNNIDNINSIRLALSCATNTKPKLLERKKPKPL